MSQGLSFLVKQMGGEELPFIGHFLYTRPYSKCFPRAALHSRGQPCEVDIVIPILQMRRRDTLEGRRCPMFFPQHQTPLGAVTFSQAYAPQELSVRLF